MQTLRYIRALLPDQNYFFLADTAHLPYGDKSPDRIRQRMMAILEYMFKQ
ncbi:MAG: hypothetical protein H6766_03105 [Candidatus Peribacteria bacterium]|nr:MAG: hypothetical protein H6766_03105 [Candidatus Peribacteria bacterium]